MTPQNRAARQSRTGGQANARAAVPRGPKGGASRAHSQMFVDYIVYEIPAYRIEEFLAPAESISRFLKRTGAFRIELRQGESAYPDSPGMHPLILPLILVERGRVQLSVAAREAARPVLKQIDPGFVFGEAPLLRMHTLGEAVAAEDSTVFLIDSTVVEEIVCGSAALSRRWLEKTSALASRSARDTRMLLFGLVDSRVAALLLELAGGKELIRNVSQTEMARRLGIHRETLSVAFRAMKKRRLVRVGHRTVELLNRDELERMVAPFNEGRKEGV
ncbi:MAG: Crp/Fnr family transcriptional regulator [Blastocatellia bacterium]